MAISLIFFFQMGSSCFPSPFFLSCCFSLYTCYIQSGPFFFFFLAKVLGNTCSTSLVFLNLAFKVRFYNLTQPQKGADSEKNLSCRTIICSLLFFVIIKNDQRITLVSEIRKLLWERTLLCWTREYKGCKLCSGQRTATSASHARPCLFASNKELLGWLERCSCLCIYPLRSSVPYLVE